MRNYPPPPPPPPQSPWICPGLSHTVKGLLVAIICYVPLIALIAICTSEKGCVPVRRVVDCYVPVRRVVDCYVPVRRVVDCYVPVRRVVDCYVPVRRVVDCYVPVRRVVYQ